MPENCPTTPILHLRNQQQHRTTTISPLGAPPLLLSRLLNRELRLESRRQIQRFYHIMTQNFKHGIGSREVLTTDDDLVYEEIIFSRIGPDRAAPTSLMLTSALEIFEDDEKYGFLPLLGFHFFWFSKAHNSETS